MCGQYSKAGQTPKDAEVKGTAERKQELGKNQVLSRASLPFPSPSHEAEIQGYRIKQPSGTQEAGHGACTTGVTKEEPCWWLERSLEGAGISQQK